MREDEARFLTSSGIAVNIRLRRQVCVQGCLIPLGCPDNDWNKTNSPRLGMEGCHIQLSKGLLRQFGCNLESVIGMWCIHGGYMLLSQGSSDGITVMTLLSCKERTRERRSLMRRSWLWNNRPQYLTRTQGSNPGQPSISELFKSLPMICSQLLKQ